MAIKYNFLKTKDLINTKNLTLFSDENFKILNFKSIGLLSESLISGLIENNKDKKKKILYLNINKKQNLLIVKLKENHNPLENEKLGAKFYDFINSNLINDLTFIDKIFQKKV